MLVVGTEGPAPVAMLPEDVNDEVVLAPEVVNMGEGGNIVVIVVVVVATTIVPKMDDAMSDSVDAAAVCTPSQKIEMDESWPQQVLLLATLNIKTWTNA